MELPAFGLRQLQLVHPFSQTYVGIHFLVLVKTDLILPPTQTLKLLLGWGASSVNEGLAGGPEFGSPAPM